MSNALHLLCHHHHERAIEELVRKCEEEENVRKHLRLKLRWQAGTGKKKKTCVKCTIKRRALQIKEKCSIESILKRQRKR